MHPPAHPPIHPPAHGMRRLYQRFTLRLADRQQQQPLPLRVGITLSPVGGLWVTAHPRDTGGT